MDKETNKIHKNLSTCNEQTNPTVQTVTDNKTKHNIPYNCSAFLSVNIK